MPGQNSVVTVDRFFQGKTWQEYLDYIGSEENLNRPGPRGKRKDNTEKFRRNTEEYNMSDAHISTLRSLPKLKLLAIGEDWCPDVWRGFPVIARIAEIAGWEARFFQRDDNEDIMAEFMNQVGSESFASIPVAVLYTESHAYIGRFIERPIKANKYRENMANEFRPQDGESKEDMMSRMRKFYSFIQDTDEWDSWRHATVDEIISIASHAN